MLKKLFIIVAIFGIFTIAHAEEKDWPVTSVQRTIVSEPGWLNTSRPLTTDDLKGRIILLDFWTYACINCMHVIPELHSLEAKFGNKLTIIGVHSAKFRNERDQDNIRSAILRYDIEHPVVNDHDFQIWQKFAVHAWPTLILINPEGRIEQVYSGEGNGQKIEKKIDEMLKSYQDLLNTAPLPMALEKNKQPKTVLSFPGKLIYVENYDNAPTLFISDSGNNRIVGVHMDGRIFIDIGSGKAGSKNGDFKNSSFNSPQGLLYRDNILYVADTGNHLLRKIDLKAKTVETIAGTGEQGNNRSVINRDAMATALSSPWDLAFYPDNDNIAIAMAGLHQIWQYDINKKTVKVLAGSGVEDLHDGAYPYNALAQTSGLSVFGKRLYFVDSESSSLRYLEDGEVKTLIGKGLFDFGYTEGDIDHGLLQHPIGIFANEREVLIADSLNNSIRKFIFGIGLRNFLGNGIKGDAVGSINHSRFNEPNAVIAADNKVFIADTNNNAIKIFDGQNVSRLDILPPAETAKSHDYQENLPNLKKLDFAKVASGKEIKMNIIVPRGWHINEEAPSWLSLFIVNGDKFTHIASFDLDQIKQNHIMLPALNAEKAYKLQGSFYYCQKSEGSECYIESIEKLIKAEANSKTSLVKIPLDKPNGK